MDSTEYFVKICLRHINFWNWHYAFGPLLVFLSLFGVEGSMLAQNRSSYSDSLKICNYKGVGNFSYHKHKQDTVLDGEFTFQCASVNLPELEKPIFLDIEGTYKSNVPTGYWEMTLGDYTIDQSVGYDRNIFLVRVNGFKINIKGKVNKRKAIGEWMLNEIPLKKSQPGTPSFNSRMSFSDGRLEGSLSLSDLDYILEADIVNNADQQSFWTLKNIGSGNKEVIEKWHFENGNLLKLDLLDSVKLDLRGGNNSRFIKLNLDTNFFKLLQLKLQIQDSVQYDFKEVKNLFSKNSSLTGKFDSIFSALGIDLFKRNIRIGISSFPYDKNELQALDTIYGNYQAAKKVFQKLMSHSTLGILEHSNPLVQLKFDQLNNLNSGVIQPLSSIINYAEDSSLVFVERGLLFNHFFPKESVSEIRDSIEFLKRTGKRKNELEEKKRTKGLEEIALVSSLLRKKLVSIERDLEKEIQDYQRNEALEKTEILILAQVDTINSNVDSVRAVLSSSFQAVLDSIDDFVVNSLNDYLENSAESDGLNEAQKELKCLRSVNALVIAIAGIPDSLKKMEAHYTEVIWNPFTQTNMEEIQKKRILEAYKEILQTHYIQFVTNHISCDNIEELSTFPQKLYGRIFDLKRVRTKSIEHKLRYTLSIKELEGLFKINIPN